MIDYGWPNNTIKWVPATVVQSTFVIKWVSATVQLSKIKPVRFFYTLSSFIFAFKKKFKNFNKIFFWYKFCLFLLTSDLLVHRKIDFEYLV